MRDLRADLAGLWRLASQVEPARGGRVILFVAAHAGEGTSSVAASFALIAASRAARTAWLVDLDIRRNTQYTAFAQGIIKDAGRPGHALDASLGAEQIYAVAGREKDPAYGKLFNAHQIDGLRLLVTRFRRDRLAAGEKVQLRTAPGWWTALRAAADWIVIDAPPLERTRAALAFVSQADGVVLVVKADETAAADVAAMRQDIEAHGGRVLGIVMNRIQDDALLAGRLDGSL
jgi:MinD-like ATPase involved in chromosome partitioning or flagellar assembly